MIDLRLGDCLELLPSIAAASVDAVVTDPPYGMKNNCDYTRFTMGPNGHGQASKRNYEAITGDDQPFDPSPWLVFPRVILFGANHFGSRLPVGTTLVWIKRLDGGFGSFLSDAEIAWMKGGHGVYCQRDTSLMAETRKRTHPTQKPVSLMRWCIEKAKLPTGATVLDPYMGTGATGIAAVELGYNFIGIEINPDYFAIAQKRIEAAAASLRQLEVFA